MIDALSNLMACILIAMLGAYFLHESWAFDFWPATAGSFYVLILSKALQS